jgi:CBS domain-containing protein
MRTNVVALPGNGTIDEAREIIRHSRPKGQYLFPVIDGDRSLLGVVTRAQLLKLLEEEQGACTETRISEIASVEPVVAFGDETLRLVVFRMADSGLTRLPVLDSRTERRLVGMISLNDLLRARTQNLAEERVRERVLRMRIPFGRREVHAKKDA